ncbi:MAG: 30S ribosomal protein S6 [Coriobacteriales bacterium]|jgi:small subunit ribosomal protein S6|nr:30S ribosomal protein S6 [Coriobacteriales bacterium]
MKAYELLFFVNPTIEQDAREATLARVETAITSQGGVLDKVEDWGRHRLAFEIDKLTDGDYTLIDFHAQPTSIAEIDRVLRIADAVKRHMIVNRPDRD